MRMRKKQKLSVSFRAALPVFAAVSLVAAPSAQTQPVNGNVQDPGVRGGAASAGGAVPGLSPALTAVFNKGLANFQEAEAVKDGLGPRFNANSCALCHSQPAIGGTSPASNPLLQFVNSQNKQPPFIQADGPIREVRFISNADGSPDGGVHALFTTEGRSDTPSGCNIQQPDFSNSSNMSFRVPTPTFGLGLIEAVTDSTLAVNLANNSGGKSALGIFGRLNRNGNDGTITRFGWKAQNKSLLLFSAEAYNVEMGVTNFIFNTEREESVNCSPTAPPNSIFNIGGLTDQAVFDDITNFANFMRFLAAPARGPIDNTVTQGSNQFFNIGCANCHTVTLQTGASPFPQLANQTINPFSDFALHHMGPGLADNVSQGLAGGDEFRTAPLWGLGQRVYLLHDGRTMDLLEAIRAHSSQGNSQYPASEANAVVNNFFNQLNPHDQQAILNFLRSL